MLFRSINLPVRSTQLYVIAMRLALRSSLNRFIARLMCWVLLFAWMAGAANACAVQVSAAVMAAQAAAQAHAAGEGGHRHHHHPHHRHDAVGPGHHHDAQGHDMPAGQPACKALCEGERNAVAKPGAGDPAGPALLDAATPGTWLLRPAPMALPVPHRPAGALPAPPPIPIALLRLTI